MIPHQFAPTHSCLPTVSSAVCMNCAWPPHPALQSFSLQEEVFRKREEALKRRDLELQESLIRFSKFLQENDSKRARAEKKAADEVRVRQAKEVEIGKLAEVMEELTEERERIDIVVDKRMRCVFAAAVHWVVW